MRAPLSSLLACSWPPLWPLLLLSACAGGSGKDSYAPSLAGPRPEGCDRAAYDPDALLADLAYLASPELDGRAPGTEGDREARDFVAERFDCLGIPPLDGLGDYEQPFTSSDGEETANVLALLPGADSDLREEVIVLSAHIDHFGDGLLGANDNASGVAALLAIAQEFSEAGQAPARSVLFAAFGAEEPGFEGSEFFAQNVPDSTEFQTLHQVVYNLNMDMVGSYDRSGTLYALGAFEGTLGADVVSANATRFPALDVSYDDGSDLSDNVTFCGRGIPYVFFWTEDEDCYHAECDTSGNIDSDALPVIAALVGATTFDVADSDEDLAAAVDPGNDVCMGE